MTGDRLSRGIDVGRGEAGFSYHRGIWAKRALLSQPRNCKDGSDIPKGEERDKN